MTCKRCRKGFDEAQPRCPHCGEPNRAASGVFQTSTVLISERGRDRVYRSVEDVPARLRARLQRSTSGSNAATFTMGIPLAIFDRNQGEIARTRYAISQAQYGLKGTNGQVITDVRDAYEGLQNSDRVVKLYRSGYLDISRRNRDISEYAYQRGATTLLDFLDAERSYRSTQLAYRQAVAAYLVALEQLYQAVGTRSLL